MLDDAFERARREKRLAFIPYVMAGDPDLETTEAILVALSDAGADVIELGVPYSDPLADGPTIAAAGQRALRSATHLREVLALAWRCRTRRTPIVLFTYYNPVYQFGLERFARESARAGVAGVIIPDVALDESAEVRAALRARGLTMPLLVAPSTPYERAARIVDATTGFVYVVSRLGVTGSGDAPDFGPLRRQLALLRDMTNKPLAVGFGLSRPQDVRNVGTLADAVVVGSALIDAFAGMRAQEAATRVRDFVAPLIAALPVS
jgi:tryptophan synthase alpha chain